MLKFWNAPFFSSSESNRKNGAFQNFRTQESWAFQNFSMWSILKQKRNRKWNYSILGISKFYGNAITWQNLLSHAFWGISNNLPYHHWYDIINHWYLTNLGLKWSEKSMEPLYFAHLWSKVAWSRWKVFVHLWIISFKINHWIIL